MVNNSQEPSDAHHESEIAVIGISGRFPGSANRDQFRRNLREAVESISFFSEEELAASGVAPALYRRPDYVPARGILEDVDLFDAALFDIPPGEAELTDCQHRVFLECAWEALEDAGYDPEQFPGAVGVFAGSSQSTYAQSLLRDGVEEADRFRIGLGGGCDHLAPRVSYTLNLTGPSINVQTACSTSLVAVHMACQSLLSGESELALAGGVSIAVPIKAGYRHYEGGILSPDGHCRAFDAGARGTVAGTGAGVVVLKRLEPALADGDVVHAVIKGSAVNNDGRAKVGYTAPGGRGQAAVVAEALAVAGVDPETIGYLEAHGTGTQLGDPVEIAALTRAFRRSTAQHGFCALGSLKTNIGHLDAAAGVAGLIKAVLSLRHGELYPSLHFEEPNPEIDFAASPFYVNTRLQPWPRGDTPRRAGVSSFGIGGTNAHAVLEEPPETEPSGPSRPEQILVLSAGTATALEAVTANLRGYLDEHPALSPRELADAAATLALGRRALEHRRMLVVRDPDDARATLAATDSPRVFTRRQKAGDRPVVFMFPGQGAQHVNMGREVYDREPVFRRHVDRGCELLAPHLGVDLRQLLYPAAGAEEEAAERLRQTAITQPALFVVEYALAQLWKEWGIRPEAMIGHSIGEYVAACLAGVMSLEDALALVALRGRLIQETAAGAMLSVPLEPDELPALEERGLSLAAVNAPALCVISGPAEAIDAVAGELAGQGVECRRLKVSHAFHSPLIEPMLEPFAAAVGRVALHPPRIPYLSNLTGTWITAEEAASADYWVRHLRHTVRFADGVAALLEEEGRILLEVGPGRTISSAVRKQPAADAAETLLCSLPHPGEPVAAPTWLFTTLGRLWLAGAAVKWVGYYAGERRCRRELPLYPFERRSYWIAPRRRSVPGETETETKTKMEMEMEMETETEMEMGMGMGMEMEMEMGGHPRPELDVVYVAPRDDLERGIAETWQTFLGLERVGVHDNFFELGGNSLLASQVVARVHESYGVELSMEDFFEANTVADLARAVEAVRREEPAAEAPPITPGKEGRL